MVKFMNYKLVFTNSHVVPNTYAIFISVKHKIRKYQ